MTRTASSFASNVPTPVDLKVSADGSLYYLARGGGGIVGRIQFNDPMLISETNSDLAIALDSVWRVRDPFPFTNPNNFSSDKRNRISLFGMNMALLPGENKTAVMVTAEDAGTNFYLLEVEFVGQVPGFNWLTQINVRFPDNMPSNQTYLVSATIHGRTTNKVRIRLK